MQTPTVGGELLVGRGLSLTSMPVVAHITARPALRTFAGEASDCLRLRSSQSEARQLSGPRLASLQVPPQLLCGTAAWIWRGTGYLLFISEMPTPQHTQPTKNPNKVNPSSLDMSRRTFSQ